LRTIANQMADLPRGANQHSSIDEPSIGQAQAAELMQVGKATVERARRVEREAPGTTKAWHTLRCDILSI
jgi:hypothetical protein